MSVVTYKGFPMFSLGDNWCAKCADCGEVLTKFDFTEDEARGCAESVTHKCPRAVDVPEGRQDKAA